MNVTILFIFLNNYVLASCFTNKFSDTQEQGSINEKCRESKHVELEKAVMELKDRVVELEVQL